jgi:hypothetical protein
MIPERQRRPWLALQMPIIAACFNRKAGGSLWNRSAGKFSDRIPVVDRAQHSPLGLICELLQESGFSSVRFSERQSLVSHGPIVVFVIHARIICSLDPSRKQRPMLSLTPGVRVKSGTTSPSRVEVRFLRGTAALLRQVPPECGGKGRIPKLNNWDDLERFCPDVVAPEAPKDFEGRPIVDRRQFPQSHHFSVAVLALASTLLGGMSCLNVHGLG